MSGQFSILMAFIALLTGSVVRGNEENHCSEKIFLSNESSKFAVPRKTVDVCLEISPPGGDTLLGTIINTAGLSFHVNGDHKVAPSSIDKHHCLMLTFRKHCKLWEERRKEICPGSLTVLTIYGPTTVRLRAYSNLTDGQVNSEASISYLPVGQYNGVLQDCIDAAPPTTITTEEITEPTEKTREQQTTQSSVTTQTAKTTVLMKTIHLTSESITSQPLVTNIALVAVMAMRATDFDVVSYICSKDGNDLEDEHENDLSTPQIVLIVMFVIVVCLDAIRIVVSVVYHRRGTNPKDVENGGVSGDDLLNGNQSVTSNSPGGSREMQPV